MTLSPSFSLPTFLLITIINAFLLAPTTSYNNHTRQALEIIIGVGGGYDPSPPAENPSCPPPPPPPLQPSPTRPKPSPLPPRRPSPSPALAFESIHIKQAYYVIQNFKKLIKSDPLNVTKTWNGPHVCKYRGFFCDTLIRDNQSALAGVTFNGFNFDGPSLTIEGFADRLPDIIVFHANSNHFKGGIPREIVNVNYLFELDLSNNKYTCAFPYQVLAATNLTFLDLRFNQFSGAVPDQVFGLDLDVLFLNNNGFFQRIPEALGNTPALYVTLANNLFTGTIPSSIGRAGKTLLEILLLGNQLSGCLPVEIGHLEKTTLFDASKNFLTGPIPLSFACLRKMEVLNLGHNELYGPVPELVCQLPNLYNLTLSENYFTKVGPECRKLIAKKALFVERNCIAGLPGQRSAAECGAFFRRAKRCADGRWFHWMPCAGMGKGRRSLLELPGAGVPRSYGALNPRQP